MPETPGTWRRQVMLASLLLGVLVLGPAVGYPLLAQPAWSLMYALDPAELEPAPRLLLLIAAPLAALLGAQITSGLLQRRALTTGIVMTSLAAAASVGLAVWGLDRIWRVGSHDAYQESARQLMPTLVGHPLGPGLLLFVSALALSWWYGLVTLRRVSRGAR